MFRMNFPVRIDIRLQVTYMYLMSFARFLNAWQINVGDVGLKNDPNCFDPNCFYHPCQAVNTPSH